MKQGGQPKAHGGFTIVETLIVLAVSGLLFASAAAMISGKQNRTEFTTSIHNLQQKLQQVINETASGYYPNGGDFKCSGDQHPVNLVPSLSGSDQGANHGCIFLGKAVQFGLAGTDGDASGLGVIPLIGNQYAAGTDTVQNAITDALPRALYTGPGAVDQEVMTEAMQSGLTVATANHDSTAGCPSSGMCYMTMTGAGPRSIGMVAFVAGDSSGNLYGVDPQGNIASGSQALSLYGVNGSVVNETYANASTHIGNSSGTPTIPSDLTAASQVRICIASGSTNDSGLFTISSDLHVELQVKVGSKVCA